MKALSRCIWLILGLIATSPGVAQERSLEVSLEREEILIGEQIGLNITLKAATPDTVVFPTVGEAIGEHIEVLQRSKIDTQFVGDQLEQRVLTQALTITSFDSGYFAQAPLQGSINGDSVASNPFLLTVQTVPIDTAKGIADIKDIQDVPFAWKEWFEQNWPWMALGLAIIAAIIGLIYYLRNLPQTPAPTVEPVVPVRPADEIALEALAALKDKKYWQQGEIKRFYIELSNILRAFLEGHFHIPAMEQTSDEIMRSVQHQADISKEQQQALRQLLFLADLVKFAKEKPIGSENERNLTVVEDFVKAQAAMRANAEQDNQAERENG
jgi:hypothetical protein